VHVSGGLQVRGAGGTGKTVLNSNELIFTSSAAALMTKFGVASPYYGLYNSAEVNGVNNSLMSVRCGNASMYIFSNGDIEVTPNLASVTNKTLKLSASDKNNTAIVAQGGHLILSSVASGSLISCVAISGALKLGYFTTSSLPVTPQSASLGSVVYVSDLDCFAGLTSAGWVRFLTASL
jgi:hypothetical protein